MSIDSRLFLFLFLPLAIAMFWRAIDVRACMWTLLVTSAVFFAWWSPLMLAMLIAGGAVNYWLSQSVSRHQAWLMIGIVSNLGLLVAFRYIDPVFSEVTGPGDVERYVVAMVFASYILYQVSYLYETQRCGCAKRDPLAYALDAIFFPKLLAGDITNRENTVSQLTSLGLRVDPHMFAHGLILLVLGLFKKVVLADGLGAWIVDPAFAHPDKLSAAHALLAVIAWSLQIYFLFTAYADMAVGVANMFGVRLGINYDAPYLATNIAEFWERWNISLGAFLRNRIYTPLAREHGIKGGLLGLALAALIVGLWYGFGWAFLLFGAMHGAMYAVYALWHTTGRLMPKPMGILLTFFSVSLAWVPLRTGDVGSAIAIWESMIFFRAPIADETFSAVQHEHGLLLQGIAVTTLLIAILMIPTAHSLLSHYFRPNKTWAFMVASIALASFVNLR